MSVRLNRLHATWPLALLAIPLIAGCSSPPGELLYPVAGRVTYAGKPLTTGSVTLVPDTVKGNKSDHRPTGTIGADGRYTIYSPVGRLGAPPGWYKVAVRAHEPALDTGGAHPGLPKYIIPQRYAGNETTPLAVEVLEKPAPGAYDLVLEAK